ncbi:SWIM zinc finger family protein [Natrinema amylolyticum]|uniref:SWIM zinc finger family protein n=1 Tax=Natrinema amylolyticum TaxID=2878679 RepID=UPI001CF9B3BD|nr:SWIM zinc finger family protein [Natrinema amylolyticum]
MSTNPLSKLEFTRRTAKRAQYEAFEYTLTPTGVRVRNGSHAKPKEHEYVVTVTNGLPIACECPADDHYEGACKHRVAVAICRPILEAVTQQQLTTDGGRPIESHERTAHSDLQANAENVAAKEECDCPETGEPFPCWNCVRTGRRTLEECR